MRNLFLALICVLLSVFSSAGYASEQNQQELVKFEEETPYRILDATVWEWDPYTGDHPESLWIKVEYLDRSVESIIVELSPSCSFEYIFSKVNTSITQKEYDNILSHAQKRYWIKEVKLNVATLKNGEMVPSYQVKVIDSMRVSLKSDGATILYIDFKYAVESNLANKVGCYCDQGKWFFKEFFDELKFHAVEV